MASDPTARLLTAKEFLRIDFGPGLKAELDRGMIRMMAGGSVAHGRVQMNLYRFLGGALRGSGCRPYGSDVAIETARDSIRYPDVTVDCGAASDAGQKALTDPRVLIEVLSPSTRSEDEGVKLAEYLKLATVDTIAFVDPDTERLRVVQRTGREAWSDVTYSSPAPLDLPSLNLSVPHDEIFARD